MQNPVKKFGWFNIISSAVCILTTLFIVVWLLSGCDGETPDHSILSEPQEILCISEKGDTVARFKTIKKPLIFETSGVIVTYFEDLETGKKAEIRTRTGTIICQ